MIDIGLTQGDRNRIALRLHYDQPQEAEQAFQHSGWRPDQNGNAFDRGFQEGCQYMYAFLQDFLPERVTGPRGTSVQNLIGQTPAYANREYTHTLKTLGMHPAEHCETRKQRILGDETDATRHAFLTAHMEGFHDGMRLLLPYVPTNIRTNMLKGAAE